MSKVLMCRGLELRELYAYSEYAAITASIFTRMATPCIRLTQALPSKQFRDISDVEPGNIEPTSAKVQINYLSRCGRTDVA